MEALSAVVQHKEGERIIALENENARLQKRLELLDYIQLKSALTNDIFSYFDKISRFHP